MTNGPDIPEPEIRAMVLQVIDDLSQHDDLQSGSVLQEASRRPVRRDRSTERTLLTVTHQIRTARNEAGHPVTVDPVTAEEVHACLLIFPELAALAKQLEEWPAVSSSSRW